MFLDHGGWVCDIFDLIKNINFEFIFQVKYDRNYNVYIFWFGALWNWSKLYMLDILNLYFWHFIMIQYCRVYGQLHQSYLNSSFDCIIVEG